MLRLYGRNYSKKELVKLKLILDNNLKNLMETCDEYKFHCKTCPNRNICDDFDRLIKFIKDEVTKDA